MIHRLNRFPRQPLSITIVALAALCACAEDVPAPQPAATEAPARSDVADQDSGITIRQGPFRVTCYKDESIVFEHGTIYRVYRPNGADAGWSYETGDGLKYRGRIGENVNCVWQ